MEIFSSLQGLSPNKVHPNPPFEAISTLDEVKPAAPISCIAIIESSSSVLNKPLKATFQ